MEEVSGQIVHITYQNPDNAFTVAKLQQKKGSDPVTVVGILPGLQIGEAITGQGSWKKNTNYGIQFEIKTFEVEEPTGSLAIQKYLASGLVKGIGSAYAERIVKKFGEQTLEVLDHNIDALRQVDGIGKKRLEKIKESWKQQRSLRKVVLFLQQYSISPGIAQKVYKTYGVSSIETVKENPYKLASEVYGIGFKTADSVAQKMQIPLDSPIRLLSGMEYLLVELSGKGHTCYPVDLYLKEASTLLSVEADKLNDLLDVLIAKDTVKIEILEEEETQRAFIWLSSHKLSETLTVKHLQRIMINPAALPKVKIDESLDWLAKQSGIQLAEQQQAAIVASFNNKVLVITGGPGTGKSTITKAIIDVYKQSDIKIALAAPTGKAAKRLSEINQLRATTIHSLLEFDFHFGGFKRNSSNPIKSQLLIIDEASMLDSVLFFQLLSAIPDDCKLLLIGDIDQLPSVGPGNILKDVIDSGKIPVIKLTEIFRQGKDSNIILNAHNINQGKLPDLRVNPEGDFFFIPEVNAPKLSTTIIELACNRLPSRYNFDPFEDIQILCPMKKGVIGTQQLNQQMQLKLNPEGDALQKFGRDYRLGDKVMQLKNNYEKKVFNGDTGLIVKVDTVEEELTVKIDGKDIDYTYEELDELDLAYAVSVHKFQGSECPCIIMPVHTTHYRMLYRNLLYTGITRGKKLVVLIGTKKALTLAIENTEAVNRFTGLKSELQTLALKKGLPDVVVLPLPELS